MGHAGFDGLVEFEATGLVEVASGLQFPEGSVALDDGSVLLVEIERGTLSRVLPDGSVEVVADKFVGPTAIVMSYDDVVAPAKLLAEFMKDRENFSIRGAVVEGKLVDAKGVAALAKLPGLNELRAQILGMLAQPATKIARIVGTPGQQLARVLGARKEQLEKQA